MSSTEGITRTTAKFYQVPLKHKRSQIFNSFKSLDPKTYKNNLWIIYVVTAVCIFILLAVIVGVVIYIWNKRAVINRIYGTNDEIEKSINNTNNKNKTKINKKSTKHNLKSSTKQYDDRIQDNDDDDNNSTVLDDENRKRRRSNNNLSIFQYILQLFHITRNNNNNKNDKLENETFIITPSSSITTPTTSTTTNKLSLTQIPQSLTYSIAPTTTMVTQVQSIQPQIIPNQSYYTGNSHTISLPAQIPVLDNKLTSITTTNITSTTTTTIALTTQSALSLSTNRHITVNLPMTSKMITTSTNPITGPSSICSSSRSHQRAKNKGLLESRRGSRTSLTLSLSPSIDSMSSTTRSPSPPLPSTPSISIRHNHHHLNHHIHHPRHPTSPAAVSQHQYNRMVHDSDLFNTDNEQQDLTGLETSSNFLTISQLEARVNGDPELHFQEFWSLPMNHTTRAQLSISGMVNKNRYKTILPNEQTRVVLPQIKDNFLSTYINANYIRGYNNAKRFIATQGPMPQTIVDFWRMVWHVQASSIVMLTKLMENNKRKCENYLPSEIGKKELFEDISVIVESISQMEGYVVRKLCLRKEISSNSPRSSITPVTSISSSQCLYTNHYWFTSWPDHGSPSPETTSHLLALVDAVEFSDAPSIDHSPPPPQPTTKALDSSPSSTSETTKLTPQPHNTQPPTLNIPNPTQPVIVHCSAGLGRTGCFLALCTGVRQLYYENGVDILAIVARMRLDRGGLVSNNDQYEYLHRALLQYSNSSRIKAHHDRHNIPHPPSFFVSSSTTSSADR